jgi:coenzyme F420-reducing hydrogenase beta subunit
MLRRQQLCSGKHRRVTAYPREGKMRAQLWDGSTYEMELTAAEPFTRAGCARCDDYLGESADIAVGSVGAVSGSSTMIVRTAVGQVFVQNALTMKLIETQDKADKDALERASADKDRRRGRFDELQLADARRTARPAKRSPGQDAVRPLVCSIVQFQARRTIDMLAVATALD